MILSIGTLLSELSASDSSSVGRLFPFVLLAFAILVVVAVVLGLKNLGTPGEEDDREPPDR